MNFPQRYPPVVLVCLFIACVHAAKSICCLGVDKKVIESKLSKYVHASQGPLKAIEAAVKKLKKMAEDKSHLLHEFQKTLNFLGPVTMVVSVGLSLASAYLPKSDSPELKFMKESFDYVTKTLNQIEHQVSDLHLTVRHEITKSSYGEYQRVIVSLFEHWQAAINSSEKRFEEINRAIFMKQFELHYKDAASQLFKSMTGYYNGELNNNLLETSKEKYKCHEYKIRKLCSTVTQTIIQGISIESAFYTYYKYQRKVRDLIKDWAIRFHELSAKCESVITKCNKSWKNFTKSLINDVYNSKEVSGDETLARRAYEVLSTAFVQRQFVVGVYSDQDGWNQVIIDVEPQNPSDDNLLKWRISSRSLFLISFDQNELRSNGIETKSSVFNPSGTLRIGTCQQSDPPVIQLATTQRLSLPKINRRDSRLNVYFIQKTVTLSFSTQKNRNVQFTIQVPNKCTAPLTSRTIWGFMG